MEDAPPAWLWVTKFMKNVQEKLGMDFNGTKIDIFFFLDKRVYVLV